MHAGERIEGAGGAVLRISCGGDVHRTLQESHELQQVARTSSVATLCEAGGGQTLKQQLLHSIIWLLTQSRLPGRLQQQQKGVAVSPVLAKAASLAAFGRRC